MRRPRRTLRAAFGSLSRSTRLRISDFGFRISGAADLEAEVGEAEFALGDFAKKSARLVDRRQRRFREANFFGFRNFDFLTGN
jgi:hypothetical protein